MHLLHSIKHFSVRMRRQSFLEKNFRLPAPVIFRAIWQTTNSKQGKNQNRNQLQLRHTRYHTQGQHPVLGVRIRRKPEPAAFPRQNMSGNKRNPPKGNPSAAVQYQLAAAPFMKKNLPQPH